MFEIGVQMLIDTGSAHTFLHTDVWKQIPLADRPALQPCDVSLVAANGQTLDVKGMVEMPISLGGRIFSHMVVIADLDTKGILGIDFLQAYDGICDLGKRRFVLAGREVPVVEEKHVTFCCRVALTQTVTLEPGGEMIIPGRVLRRNSTPVRGVVEPTLQFQINKPGILVAKAYVAPTAHFVPLRVFNVNSEPITIYNRTHVALVHPAEVVPTSQQDQGDVDKKFQEDMKLLLERSSAELDDRQAQKLEEFLAKHQTMFAKSGELGRTDLTYHRIDVDGHPPIKQPVRRVPFHKRKEIERQVHEMLDQGVISPSESPWNNPVLLVMKKDGTARFCLDMRRLNDCTRKDAYALPRIDETFDALSGSRWFSTMDLAAGYWQVEIDPRDRSLTAFSAASGHYQFNVMSFGLTNAPATFERLMERVLAGLQWEICLVYLDDIIVMASSFDQHLERLEIVFSRLRAAGLKLKPKKCNFFRSEVLYLGHYVTASGLSTDPEKVNRVKNWQTPRTLKEVRAFLGLAGYYRKFIRDFSVIASPLHKLSQKDERFKWTSTCEEAFLKLKVALTSAPVLGYPDFSRDFILDTDASGEGSGAVLSQLVDGQECVIAYASKKFSKAERHYSVTRRELLAVVTAVKHFRHYLFGRRFTVRTDHGSLRWLLNFKDAEGQMARWLETLGMFDFVIEHRAGTKHSNADALSRMPLDEDLGSKVQSSICAGVFLSKEFSPDAIRKAQREDSCLIPLILGLETNERPAWSEVARLGVTTKSLWMQWGQLMLSEGVLYRRFEKLGFGELLQLVVPVKLKGSVLLLAHDHKTAGHLGRTRTLEKIRQSYFWVNYRQDVEDWVRTCVKCQRRKGTPQKRRAAMQASAVGFPMERVAMDIMGPLPISERGNRYLLVVMDYFTKWAEAYPLPNQEAVTVAQAFVTQFVCRYGMPMQIHTDRGKNFDSRLLQAICQLMEISKTLTSSYRPQSDGLVERLNRTLEDMVSKYVQYDQRDWDVHIPFVLMAYRASPQETTGISPNLMMFGREIGLPLNVVAGGVPGSECVPEEQYARKVRERLEVAFEIARESSLVAQKRQKRYYDLKVCGQPYKVGEKVWVYNPAKTKGITPKLQCRWQGPCVIIRKLSDANYVVRKPRGRKKTEVVHFDRMKPCEERLGRTQTTGTDDPESTNNLNSDMDAVGDDTKRVSAFGCTIDSAVPAGVPRRLHQKPKAPMGTSKADPQHLSSGGSTAETKTNPQKPKPVTIRSRKAKQKLAQRRTLTESATGGVSGTGQAQSTNSELLQVNVSDSATAPVRKAVKDAEVRPRRTLKPPARYQDYVLQ